MGYKIDVYRGGRIKEEEAKRKGRVTMGHLTVVIGCMFAQKSTELVRRIRRYRSIGYQVLVVNSYRDTRYQNRDGEDGGSGGGIVTHDEKREEGVMARNLSEVEEQIRTGRFQAVVVDEGQFFSDLFDCVTRWADEIEGLDIVVAGLDGTFQREPFGDMLRLIPHAEEVVRLSALCARCRDGTKAVYSRRRGVAGQDVMVVGAGEYYEPVCRRHYHGRE